MAVDLAVNDDEVMVALRDGGLSSDDYEPVWMMTREMLQGSEPGSVVTAGASSHLLFSRKRWKGVLGVLCMVWSGPLSKHSLIAYYSLGLRAPSPASPVSNKYLLSVPTNVPFPSRNPCNRHFHSLTPSHILGAHTTTRPHRSIRRPESSQVSIQARPEYQGISICIAAVCFRICPRPPFECLVSYLAGTWNLQLSGE